MKHIKPRRRPLVEEKQIPPELQNGFAGMNANNFMSVWEGVPFGVMDGRPFCAGRFEDDEQMEAWFRANILLLRSIQARMQIFIDRKYPAPVSEYTLAK